MFVTFVSVVALANDEDPIIGYTHDGILYMNPEL